MLLNLIFVSTAFVVTAKRRANNDIQDSSVLGDGALRSQIIQKGNKLKPKGPDDASDQNPERSPKLRNRCCPYDFDSQRCKVVDDRILCGFNKNVGKPRSRDTVVQVHGGCRLRGGRLECGYDRGPYTNPRRPPGWDNPPADDAKRKN